MSIRKTAQYVIRSDSPDLGKFTLEGSRPGNILYLHASLTLLGRDGLGVLMTRSCALVKQLWVRLETHPSKCFQVVHEPMSNILLYRYIPRQLRELDRKVGLEEEGTAKSANLEDASRQVELMNYYVQEIQTRISKMNETSATTVHTFTSRTSVMYQGHLCSAFRVVVSNPNTMWNHLEDVMREQIRVGGIVERHLQVLEMTKRIQESSFSGSRINSNSGSGSAASGGSGSGSGASSLWIGWPWDL